uniref:G patch domain-containing protein 2 n=2 Tax=Cacopsylla melanoneura TaxID=428564 RepID=A0A8D8ZK49_9HEMI
MSYWTKYRSNHEPKEHWELREKFLEAHKDKFDEDRLVCLAQVFYNVEFLGCKYPDQVMKQIEDLSQGIADEHREQKKTKLQRTFVAASEAAESKVCRTSIKKKASDSGVNYCKDSPDDSTKPGGHSVGDILGNHIGSPGPANPDLIKLYMNYLDREPPLSQLIVVRMKNELVLNFNSLQRSVRFSGLVAKFDFIKKTDTKYEAILRITDPSTNRHGHLATLEANVISKPNQKILKSSLVEMADTTLSKHNFTVVINNQIYSSQDTIEKTPEKQETEDSEMWTEEDDQEIEDGLPKSYGRKKKKRQIIEERRKKDQEERKVEDEEPKTPQYISDGYEQLAENNIGSKLLKLMGWSGSGGLGKSGQGIAEPVPITGRLEKTRLGLGQDHPTPRASHASRSGGGVHSRVSDGASGEDKLGLTVKHQYKLTSPHFKSWARELLIEYVQSSNLLWFEDLIFSSSFSKEERALIHVLCQSLAPCRNKLQAKSYGKDDARHLVVSRKVAKNGRAVLSDLIQWGDNPKFSLEIPENFHQWKAEREHQMRSTC